MLNPITEDHARLPSGPVRRHPVTAPGLCNTDKPELRPLAPDPSFGPGATCLACPIRQEAPSNSCTAHRRKHAGRRLDVLNQSPGFAYEFAHFASESDRFRAVAAMLQRIFIPPRRAAPRRPAMHPTPALPGDRRQPTRVPAAGPRPAWPARPGIG